MRTPTPPPRAPRTHQSRRPRRQGAAAALLAWLVAAWLAGCGGGSSDPAPPDEGRAQALAVSQPGELTAYVQARLRSREEALRSNPGASFGVATDSGGAVAGAAAPPAPSGGASSTLVQEAGVDEADLLQGDGQHLYALQPSASSPQLNVYTRDAQGRAQKLKALALPVGDAAWVQTGGMVLNSAADALAVLTVRSERLAGDPACGGCLPVDLPFVPLWFHQSVAVQRVDVSNPAQAAVGETVLIDGRLVDSRRIGDTLYVVTAHLPRLPIDAVPLGAGAELREAAIAATTADQLLPRQRRNGGPAQPLLNDIDCWVQPGNASLDLTVTTITWFDLRSPSLAHGSRCFVGGAEALYMSPGSLYLATARYGYNSFAPLAAALVYPAEARADIHKFALGSGGVAYRGTGQVSGHLGWNPELKSYRLSEHNGDLRVLSFTGSMGWVWAGGEATNTSVAPSPATLTILRERSSDQSLQPVATLPNGKRPALLGKAGEQVHAVRFVGARGYLVTFRQVDPLYVLDLSDPADPKVAGALETPGFSDMLFPLDEGLLLGVGHAVGSNNLRGGVQLALFDVRDPTAPALLDSAELGSRFSYSGLDYSRHALNWLAVGGVARLALPVALTTPGPETACCSWTQGLQTFEVDLAQRKLKLGALRNPLGPQAMLAIDTERSLQIGHQLYHLRQGEITTLDW